MKLTKLNFFFAFFIASHGLVAMSLANVPASLPGTIHTPFMPAWWHTNIDPSWPINGLGLGDNMVRIIGSGLWLSTAILFSATAFGMLGFLGFVKHWDKLAVVGSILSLVLIALFWHPWLALGIVMNLVILVGVLTGLFKRWLGFH